MEVFLDHAVERAGVTKGAEFGVMLLDLDGFKPVNDTYGHAAGDVVLKTIGQRIASRLRRSLDQVARVGGDEFTVIVAETHRQPGLLELIAKDLLRLIGEPVGLGDGTRVSVGASIGIARFPLDGKTRQSLLDAADAAMYSIKRGGKRGFVLAGAQSQETDE